MGRRGDENADIVDVSFGMRTDPTHPAAHRHGAFFGVDETVQFDVLSLLGLGLAVCRGRLLVQKND